MARIAYAQKDTADPDIRELFTKMEADGFQVLNLYKAVARCPKIGQEFLRLGNRILFRGKLAPRLREVAILRVGDLARAPYEFTKHAAIGLKVGLSQAQIDALPRWQGSGQFDAAEQAVLAYTDEVSRGYRVSDETFARLREHLDEAETVELTITIGYYEMVCRVLEALQIEVEEETFVPLGKAD